MDNFERCHAVTARWEGGWSDHPDDPGGQTMWGVTQGTYDRWRDQRGEPRESVSRITKDTALAIYRQWFWHEVRADDLPLPLALMVYDAGVNSGPVRSIRILQMSVGATPDGAFGPKTLAAVRNRWAADPEAVLTEVMAQRLTFWARLERFSTFGRGWMRRGAHVAITAGRWLEDEHSRQASKAIG